MARTVLWVNCRWCGKKYEYGRGYSRSPSYCSRNCYEKANAQDKANRDRADAEWEATKQKIRDSGGCFSWVFKTILKIIKWILIGIVVLVVYLLITGK